MARPLINASMDQLKQQMAAGAPKMTPIPNFGVADADADDMQSLPKGGPAAGLSGSGPNLGSSPPSMGAGMPSLSSVRSHGLALGGLTHALKVHPQHAPAIKQMMAKSRAHIASYKGGGGGASAPKSFGSIGPSTMPTRGLGGMPGSKTKF
jgi:hypothetical protein